MPQQQLGFEHSGGRVAVTKSVNRLQLHFLVWQATITVLAKTFCYRDKTDKTCHEIQLVWICSLWSRSWALLLQTCPRYNIDISNIRFVCTSLRPVLATCVLCVNAMGLVPLYGPAKYLPSVCLLVEPRFKEVPRDLWGIDSLYRGSVPYIVL